MKATKEAIKTIYNYTITLSEDEIDVLKTALALLHMETMDHPERFKGADRLNDAAADVYSALYHVLKD